MSNNSPIMAYFVALMLFMNVCGAVFTTLRNDRNRQDDKSRLGFKTTYTESKSLGDRAFLVLSPRFSQSFFDMFKDSKFALVIFSLLAANIVHSLIQYGVSDNSYFLILRNDNPAIPLSLVGRVLYGGFLGREVID